VDFDGRQLLRVVHSVHELAPVDKLNRAVGFHQGHVHIPSLDHAPVDVHDRTLVVKHAHVSDVVHLVARAAHSDNRVYSSGRPVWGPSYSCTGVLLYWAQSVL
jgi:hypothetical protein